jgi:hypothetical protein
MSLTLDEQRKLREIELPESRTVGGGGEAERAGDEDEFEGAGTGTPRHADRHGQPGVAAISSRRRAINYYSFLLILERRID